MTSLNANDSQSLSFCKGLKLLESGCVENVLQVGKLTLEGYNYHEDETWRIGVKRKELMPPGIRWYYGLCKLFWLFSVVYEGN